MSEETVVIRIKVHADTRAIKQVQAQLAALSAQGNTTGSKLDDLSNAEKKVGQEAETAGKKLENAGKKARKFDKDGDKLKKTVQGLAKFFKSGFSLILKGLAINAALVAASLIGINLAFKAGAWLARGWGKVVNFAFTGAAAAAASLLTVLYSLAAAQREYAAAVQSASYGGSTEKAMTALRNIQANASLAVLGSKAVEGAFAAISRSAPVTGQLNQALTALGDFAVASGNPDKAMKAAGDFLGQLVKEGKLTDSLIKNASDVGPQFAKAVEQAKKAGKTSSQDFLKSLIGGEFSGEVKGVLDNVNNTLMGTFKRNMQMLKTEAADYGQNFLPEMTVAVEKISKILRRTMIQISANLNTFATGTFVDKVVAGVDKVAAWTAKMFNEYLPKVDGMWTKVKEFFQRMEGGWNKLVEKLRPFVEGGQVLIDMLKPIIETLLSGFGQGLTDFNKLVQDNRDQFVNFGKSVSGLFNSIGKFYGIIKEAFVDALPVIEMIVDALSGVVKMFTDIISAIKSVGSMFGKTMGGVAALATTAAAYWGLGQLSEKKTGKKGRGFGSRMRGALPIGGSNPKSLMGQAISANTVTITAGTVNVAGGLRGGGGTPTVTAAAGAAANAEAAVAQGAAQRSWAGRAGYATGKAWYNTKNFVSNNAGMLAAFGLPIVGNALDNASFLQSGDGSINGSWGSAANAGATAMMLNYMAPNAIPGLMTKVGAGGVGAAAPIAAYMGGRVAGSYTSSLALNTDTVKGMSGGGQTATGVLAGVGGGAAAGAGIGAMLTAWTGPGAAVGAAVGAVVGGIAGGISGWVNSGKNKKQSRDLAKTFVGDYDSAIEEAMAKGDVRGAMELEKAMAANAEAASAGAKHTDSFNEEYKKQAKLLKDKNAPAFKQYNDNVEKMARVTGLSTEKIADLALKLGIDLTAPIDDIAATASALNGSPIWADLKEKRNWLSQQITGGVVDAFTAPQQKKEAQQAVDQAGQGIREIVQSGGTVDQSTMGDYLTKAFEYEMLNNGGDAFKALKMLQQGVGSKNGFMYTDPNSQFYGMQDQLQGNSSALIMDAAQNFMTSDNIAAMVNDIAVKLEQETNGGIKIGNQAQVVTDLENLVKNGKFTDFIAAVDGLNNLGKGSTVLNKKPGETNAQYVDRAYRNAGDIAGVDLGLQIQNGFDPLLHELPGAMYTSITDALGLTPPWVPVNVNPVYGPPAPPSKTVPDTYSPRAGDTTSSRLKRTMGRHSMYDSMLTGKRIVTSSWRDHNLGSINSDHVTGNALDLTGQNLGAYKKLVEGEGGFAEFHGFGGTRHLHVVPEASGDTSTPVPAMAAAGGSSFSSQDVYNISIAPQPNANANDIAAEVMAQIERRNRSARERGF